MLNDKREGGEWISSCVCVCVYLLRNKCAYCARQRATLHSIPYTRINGSRQLFYVFFFALKTDENKKINKHLPKRLKIKKASLLVTKMLNEKWKIGIKMSTRQWLSAGVNPIPSHSIRQALSWGIGLAGRTEQVHSFFINYSVLLRISVGIVLGLMVAKTEKLV